MKKTLIGSLLLSCCFAVPALAQIRIVDQSNAALTPGSGVTAVAVPIDQNSPLGQTFTPTFTSMNFASFSLSNRFYSTPVTFSTSLYRGSGTYDSTALLGTSQTSTLAGGAGIQNVDFLFSNLIALIPGATYSLIVNNVTFQQTGVRDDADVLTGGQYLRGDPIVQGRLQTGSSDFVFSEGLAVPEPASWAMMILGMGAVGATLRRRSKVTTRVSYAA